MSLSKSSQQLSVRFGNILFRNFFLLYNIIYPIFKRKQDKEEVELLLRTVKEGDTVLDIGANIGFYSKILAKAVGETGKVHSFEPDKTNFSHFVHNTQNTSNIIPVNKAVAEQTKTIKLYTSKMLNVDHRTYKVDDYESEISIDAVSVDDYVSGNFKVDFIKMDIQGFELFALQGMLQTLANNPSIVVLTELWPYGLRKAGTSLEAVFSFLSQNKLKVYQLNNLTTPLNEVELISTVEYTEAYYFNILIKH